jgi:hypothetical protein
MMIARNNFAQQFQQINNQLKAKAYDSYSSNNKGKVVKSFHHNGLQLGALCLQPFNAHYRLLGRTFCQGTAGTR